MRSMASIWLFALLATACSAHVPDTPIRTDSLTVAHGTRVLLAAVEPGLLRANVKPMRPEVSIAGIRWVDPPPEGAVSLKGLDPEWMDQAGADMALLVEEETRVLRLYNPYSVVVGFEEQSRRLGARDGKPVYDHRTVPVYRTEYRHRCTLTAYRIYQYDGRGTFMGQTLVQPSVPVECPDRTDADIHYDAGSDLAAWLERHLQPVRPPTR